jgi:hypothetical protein
MVVKMDNFESEIEKIIVRHLNESCKRYGYKWKSSPEQEPETELEKRAVKLATDFEQENFPELIQLGDWFTVEFNIYYPKVKQIVMRDIHRKASDPLLVFLYLLSWGSLQGVRSIAQDEPLLGLELRDFLKKAILEELSDWKQNGGDLVIENNEMKCTDE